MKGVQAMIDFIRYLEEENVLRFTFPVTNSGLKNYWQSFIRSRTLDWFDKNLKEEKK